MNFLSKEKVLELHRDGIEEFGGSYGMRDEGAFESALMAPINRTNHEEVDEIRCAATYGFHLSKAHAFVDGNKRVAAAAMLVFLDSYDLEIEASIEEIIEIFLQIASSEMDRDQLEAFLRERTVSI